LQGSAGSVLPEALGVLVGALGVLVGALGVLAEALAVRAKEHRSVIVVVSATTITHPRCLPGPGPLAGVPGADAMSEALASIRGYGTVI
jgi:hypothetical protein